MDSKLLKNLENRNAQLIDAVIKKVKTYCSTHVDLIGITGSFNTGDIHEKSDLDLLIVVNDNEAKSIVSSCFILEDVGFDFYCSEWTRLENMANFTDPHISKLMDLRIVYFRNDQVLERYETLKNLCRVNLEKKDENILKCQKYLDTALVEYAKIILCEEVMLCLYHTFLMVKNIEYSLYLLNKTYIKKGIKRIPDELATLPLIPDNFLNLYKDIFTSDSVETLKKRATELIKSFKDFINDQIKDAKRPREISPKDLVGTYEEIYSNWKNKMSQAAKENDVYTSFMTMASCQEFYIEQSQRFNIPTIDILQAFNPSDLEKTALYFEKGMEEWKNLCLKNKVAIKKYDTLEKFISDYSFGSISE